MVMKILNKITRNIKRILGLLEYGLVIEKNDFSFKTDLGSYRKNMFY